MVLAQIQFMLETKLLGKKFGNSLKLRMGIRIRRSCNVSPKAQSAITTAVGGVYFKCRQCSFEIPERCSNTNPVWLT
jgi:hypothetical protein